MKISELRIGEDKADIEADVTDITAPREFDRFGRSLRVATATLKDESGTIKMSLWNQDIDKVAVGNRIKLTNGFVKEFQGEKQITAGKFGKIEVLEKGTQQVEQKKEVEEEIEDSGEF